MGEWVKPSKVELLNNEYAEDILKVTVKDSTYFFQLNKAQIQTLQEAFVSSLENIKAPPRIASIEAQGGFVRAVLDNGVTKLIGRGEPKDFYQYIGEEWKKVEKETLILYYSQ